MLLFNLTLKLIVSKTQKNEVFDPRSFPHGSLEEGYIATADCSLVFVSQNFFGQARSAFDLPNIQMLKTYISLELTVRVTFIALKLQISFCKDS